MGCLVRGCGKAPSVHLYVGHLGEDGHRYTGVSFCLDHARKKVSNHRHGDHLEAEVLAWMDTSEIQGRDA